MNKSEKTRNQLLDIFQGPSGMAQACGRSPQDINNWLFKRGFSKGSLLIVERAVKERGGEITVHDLISYEPPENESTAA